MLSTLDRFDLYHLCFIYGLRKSDSDQLAVRNQPCVKNVEVAYGCLFEQIYIFTYKYRQLTKARSFGLGIKRKGVYACAPRCWSSLTTTLCCDTYHRISLSSTSGFAWLWRYH